MSFKRGSKLLVNREHTVPGESGKIRSAERSREPVMPNRGLA